MIFTCIKFNVTKPSKEKQTVILQQILDLEFANEIYALVCLPVKLQHPVGTHQNPLNVLDANNMYLLLKILKIIKVVANLELMPI